jgi:hypothetical protein
MATRLGFVSAESKSKRGHLVVRREEFCYTLY